MEMNTILVWNYVHVYSSVYNKCMHARAMKHMSMRTAGVFAVRNTAASKSSYRPYMYNYVIIALLTS